MRTETNEAGIAEGADIGERDKRLQVFFDYAYRNAFATRDVWRAIEDAYTAGALTKEAAVAVFLRAEVERYNANGYGAIGFGELLEMANSIEAGNRTAARERFVAFARSLPDPGTGPMACGGDTDGGQMSQTERAIVAMLRAEVSTSRSKKELAQVLRYIRMIETGVHHGVK